MRRNAGLGHKPTCTVSKFEKMDPLGLGDPDLLVDLTMRTASAVAAESIMRKHPSQRFTPWQLRHCLSLSGTTL